MKMCEDEACCFNFFCLTSDSKTNHLAVFLLSFSKQNKWSQFSKKEKKNLKTNRNKNKNFR